MAACLVGYSRCPSAQQRFPVLPGGTRCVTAADKTCYPPSESWFCPGVSSQLVVPRKPPKGGAQDGILIRCTSADSSLSSSQTSGLLTLPVGLRPSTLLRELYSMYQGRLWGTLHKLHQTPFLSPAGRIPSQVYLQEGSLSGPSPGTSFPRETST